ncbi:MAG TPA: class IIb bacteriocin, lactobin A/cerein 7B family [Pseudohongiella sp.]|nr:class IIb bacteriocin, lactobin A/cerein 7B family [Pseudohongiella sp.]
MRELTRDEVELVNGGIAPAVVITGIKYVGGAFAAGFIGKAGADLDDYLFGSGGC